jgi:hypothetical protein
MATFDQLSAEQRAIVELVLQQGKSYEELSGMLGMPEDRIRELARDALVELAPVSVRAVEEDWRGQLADYVLGQQAGPEAAATKGHLRRSEAARSWTRSLLDSLEGLYRNGSMPAVPDGERGRRSAAAQRSPGGGLATPADAAVRRRRVLAAAGVLALLALLAVLVWPVGVLTGDDDEPAAEQANAGGGGGQNAAQQGAGAPAGIAIVVEQNGRRQLLVQAARLDPSQQREAYEVWLYNSQGDARTLGGQVTDRQGNYQAIGNLPGDFEQYRFIDISREPLDQQRGHSGESVLRGRMPRLREAQNGNSRRANVLGQSVLAPPGG